MNSKTVSAIIGVSELHEVKVKKTERKFIREKSHCMPSEMEKDLKKAGRQANVSSRAVSKFRHNARNSRDEYHRLEFAPLNFSRTNSLIISHGKRVQRCEVVAKL